MKFDYLETIRNQAIFVAAFFFVFGLIATDRYYSTFGVNYQFLDISVTHMVYRGFTEIYLNSLFLVVVLIILLGVLISQMNLGVRIFSYTLNEEYFAYATLGIALFLGCYLSVITARSSARQDMHIDTTSLRQIKTFYSKDEAKLKFVNDMLKAGHVLLLHDSGQQIIIFQASTVRASQPPIAIYRVGLSSDDFYSDAAPGS
jgi:hypothetical protein